MIKKMKAIDLKNQPTPISVSNQTLNTVPQKFKTSKHLQQSIVQN
jgi:hypothetical protein